VLREQLAILLQFFSGLDFVHMRPENAIVGALPDRITARALVNEGRVYAVYVNGAPRDKPCLKVSLTILPGTYRAEWVNTKTGNVDKVEDMEHAGGTRVLISPPYVDDIALRIYRLT
jgi:hypothetical protein